MSLPLGRLLTALVIPLMLVSCGPGTAATSGVTSEQHPVSHGTARAAPPSTPISRPQSWLKNSTLLTVYGRGFGIAPILGRLGMDGSMNDVAAQAQPFITGIRAQNGGKRVRLALHLIYGMATSCGPGSNCLDYLDDTGTDIVKQYIQPAARRGWLVILDDQLGGSTPAKEMARIIARGYLRFDNVAVALDPEFRAAPGQDVPGVPVGSVTASELNAAEDLMERYAAAHPLPHHKLLLIHQFLFGMVQQRGSVHMHLPWVDPVFVMDGFGDPGVKAHVYHDLYGKANAPRMIWRGIKLFYPNPYEQAGHADGPLMTWAQVFGHAPALDIDGQNYWLSPAPQVVVIA